MPIVNFIDGFTSAEKLTALIEALPGGGADVLRLDRLHPLISGNKAFKLQPFLQRFAASPHRRLLSFGGPFSNHLHALAALGRAAAVPVVLVVRGYAHLPLTPTLQDCADWGAELVFVDKKTYAGRYDPQWQQALSAEYDALVIGEGGAGEGVTGCRVLATACAGYDEVWLACGTGTTALGLAQGLSEQKLACRVVGVNAVADQGALVRAWHQQMPADVDWRVVEDAHGGGFGRSGPELLQLIERLDQQGLPLEPVYTGKLLQAYEQAVARGECRGRVLLVHSGGLQGRRGYGLPLPMGARADVP